MCGIGGFIHNRDDLDSERVSRAMLSRIQNRGPDGEGAWSSPSNDGWIASLVHTRLAIIDLQGGVQPMANGRFRMVFNGEIYNYRQLRAALESQGEIFETSSDTEVLLKHFVRFGAEGIKALRGIFAFAVWDEKNQVLHLARDRFGVKPLYFGDLAGGGIIFGSELSTLLCHPSFSRSIDRQGVADFLFNDYAPAPRSVFKNARKLEPGSYFRWQRGRVIEYGPYCDPLEPSPSRPSHLTAELDELLERSVNDQLVSDVPVGLFLSGGLDSAAIGFYASRQEKRPVRSFSIGFEDPRHDESHYAELTAKALGFEHQTRIMKERDTPEIIDRALSALDEPIADPSVVPTYFLSELASQHVKVVLSGDGGDELMGGYPTYRAHQVAAILKRMPRTIRHSMLPSLAERLPVRPGYQSLEWKLKRFFLRWDEDDRIRHFRWMSSVDLNDLRELLGERDLLPSLLISFSEARTGANAEGLNRFLLLDFFHYLPGSVLAKVDRMSMAHGLEVRPPFLDPALAAWAFQVEGEEKVSLLETKRILRRLMANRLPREISRLPKRGFAPPTALWFRMTLKERFSAILRSSPLWDHPDLKLRQPSVAGWFREHLELRQDHGKALWAIYVLHHWAARDLG